MESRNCEPFSEDEVHKMFIQMIKAIQHCHAQGVVHFDLKLDNIMIDNKGQIKIIDFGLCDFITEASGDTFTKKVGSEEYSPPELLYQDTTSFSGTKVDIWCLGVVLYALLCGTFPFDLVERESILRRGEEHPKPLFVKKIPEKAKDLINKMLNIDPAKRVTMPEILSHPWVSGKSTSTRIRKLLKVMSKSRKRADSA